jgi:hypothetical protein
MLCTRASGEGQPVDDGPRTSTVMHVSWCYVLLGYDWRHWYNHAYVLCLWVARDNFLLRTDWYPYVEDAVLQM